jgi:hypothetical protein
MFLNEYDDVPLEAVRRFFDHVLTQSFLFGILDLVSRW